MELRCVVGKKQLPHVLLVLLAYLGTETTFRACTQPAVVEQTIKSSDYCVPGTLNGLGISRLRVDYVERYRVEVGFHAVAADADHAEILYAKVECTIDMYLFLPSAVCHAREVKHHVGRRLTHEHNATLKLKT